MEDEERQKKLELGKAKVRAAGCRAAVGAVAGGEGGAWGAPPAPRRAAWAGDQGCLPLALLSFSMKTLAVHPADTSVGTGWGGFFLGIPQGHPPFDCIAMHWCLLLLELQPVALGGSFLGSAVLVLFKLGFRAFPSRVRDLLADRDLGFLRCPLASWAWDGL